MLSYKYIYGVTSWVLPSDDRDIFDMLLDIFKVGGGHFETCDETDSKLIKNRKIVSCNVFHTSLRDIGFILGVTPTRVQQIEQRALQKLKHPRNSRLLRGFLDN